MGSLWVCESRPTFEFVIKGLIQCKGVAALDNTIYTRREKKHRGKREEKKSPMKKAVGRKMISDSVLITKYS